MATNTTVRTKAEKHRAWEATERKLTPRNRTEFWLYTLITSLTILGFFALLSLVFDWAEISLGTVGTAAFGGLVITAAGVHWQSAQEGADATDQDGNRP